MNKLLKLRKELRLSMRQLNQYVDVSASVITYLENEQRPFRQVHIDKLTSFFNVTSDYLLGRSDIGYIVHTEYGDNELLLSESEYNKLKDNIVLTVVDNGKSFEFDFTDSVEENKTIFSRYSVYRELKGELGDYHLQETLLQKYIDLGKQMDSDELNKAIKFIEEYILYK